MTDLHNYDRAAVVQRKKAQSSSVGDAQSTTHSITKRKANKTDPTDKEARVRPPMKRKTCTEPQEAPPKKTVYSKRFQNLPSPLLQLESRKDNHTWFQENGHMQVFRDTTEFFDRYKESYMKLLKFRLEIVCKAIADEVHSQAETHLNAHEMWMLGTSRRAVESLTKYCSDPATYATTQERLRLLLKLMKDQKNTPSMHALHVISLFGDAQDESDLSKRIVELISAGSVDSPEDTMRAALATDLADRRPRASVPLDMVSEIINSVDQDMRHTDTLYGLERWPNLRSKEIQLHGLISVLAQLLGYMGQYE